MAKQDSISKPVSKEAFNKQEIIDRLEIAENRSRGISMQLAGLQNFLEHVDKGEDDLYRFACALEVLIGKAGGDAEYVGDIIRTALKNLQEGGVA
jgi:hypothetical protein